MAAVCWDAGSWNISKYNDYPLEKNIYRKSVTGMSEIEKRTRRCCFTGHCPEKLTVENTKLCREVEGAIDKAISDGFYTFISGMSRGVDLWAATIVLSRKQLHPEIHLICAIPHPGFEENGTLTRLLTTCKHGERIRLTILSDEGYFVGCIVN